MTEDHQLLVLDEPPVVGREANAAAWEGYATSLPEYVIYPHRSRNVTDVLLCLGIRPVRIWGCRMPRRPGSWSSGWPKSATAH